MAQMLNQHGRTNLNDMIFRTDRLLVRRWRESDLPDLNAVYGDADAMRWVGDGRPITDEECCKWMEITRENYEKRGYGMFAVERNATPGVIGFCGIVHPGGQVEPEIKYAYHRSCWGQGFATEVVVGLISYGVEVHGLRQLIATTAPDNTASHRVLLKAGMTRGKLVEDEDGSPTQVFEWFA